MIFLSQSVEQIKPLTIKAVFPLSPCPLDISSVSLYNKFIEISQPGQISHKRGVRMADRTNQQLGNYRINRPIGRGGFAEVYLGEHIYLKTQVAIKILQIKVSNEDDMKGFLQEAQTIAHLLHPNLVRVTDFAVHGE